MEKMTVSDGISADVVSENLSALKAIFSEAFSEGKDGAAVVNFDVLRQLLGDAKVLTEGEEKFGLNWHGKKRARQIALTPSLGTLLPCPEESVDWDDTQNLFIEGDNLEVLKLLQRSYAGRVKLIYIDPPYNTGGDFVYPDNFKDGIRNYLEVTGQLEGGRKISSNSEASGRFHTEWLNMIYPRLKLAKNLLRRDGVVFVSIDDGEFANVRLVMDEIFGEENFLASFIWKSRQNKDNRTTTGASVDHEYMVCYGNTVRGADRDKTQYSNPDDDERGEWASANMVGIATRDRRPNLHYDLIDPKTKINYGCPDMGWRYDRKSMARLIEEDRILWPADPSGRPRRKAFLNDLDSDFTGFSTVIGEAVYTRDGTADIDSLFENRIFSFPKPVALISTLVDQGAANDDIVLDFFAGSGTTGHAVFARNVASGGNRRFILVQLPESLDIGNRDQKTAADFCDKIGKPRTIAELTKERLRRAAKKIRSDNSTFKGDLGFKAFKLAASNIRAWNPDAKDLEASLLAHVDHLIEGRSEQDVLYELLLKRGIDLCAPIETRAVGNKVIHSIGYGVLFACLSESITREAVEEVANAVIDWHKELKPETDSTVVFRDSAFADDVAKSNMAAILNQYGIKHVRSL